MTHTSEPAAPGRVSSLDALRGLAALAVVLHHCFMTVPALAAQYLAPGGATTAADWWLLYTPLHLLWAGPEAVTVFFVLSGFVLTIAVTGTRGQQWTAYYARRLIRLYVPVLGGVALGLLLASVLGRPITQGASWWVNAHAGNPHGVEQALSGGLLVMGPNWLCSQLWSLKWEVLFSLLLPLYLAGVCRGRGWWPLKLGALLGLTLAGGLAGGAALYYMPIFGLGALMAGHRQELQAVAVRIGRGGWILLTCLAGLLLTADWTRQAPGMLFQGSGWRALSGVLVGLGASLCVFIALSWPGARRLLAAAPLQWLGQRSFSLYLVHEQVVVAVAFGLGGRPNPVVLIGLALPLCLAAAELFHRSVERVALRVSRHAGQAIARPRRPGAEMPLGGLLEGFRRTGRPSPQRAG